MAGRSTGGPAIDSRTVVIPTRLLPNANDPDQQAAPIHPARSMENIDVFTQTFDALATYPVVERDGTRVQDSSRPIGELAERWERSPDALRYRVHLRPARSVWGNTLTADDVVWSWEKALAAREVGNWAAFMASVAQVQALDERIVEFVLEKPNPVLPHIFTMSMPPIFDSAEARRHDNFLDGWGRVWLQEHPCGFGPYVVDNVNRNEMTLRARDDYWSGKPAIERVVYRQLAADQSNLDALIAGEVDMVYGPSPAELQRLKGEAGISVFSAPGGSHIAMSMNMHIPPFDNPAIRKAVAWAVPYDEILSDVYKGTARPWRGVVPDQNIGYLDLLEVTTDIERSKSYLREAGRPSGFSADFYCPEGAATVELAEYISRSAARAGIELAVRPVPQREYREMLVANTIPICIAGDGHRVNDLGYSLGHDFGEARHGISNWVRYSNPEVDRLIDLAEREPDEAKHLAILQQCQRVVAEDTPWAFLAQPNFYIAYRNGLTGFAWLARNGSRPRYSHLAWAE